MPDILMHDLAGGDHTHSGAYARFGGDTAYRATATVAETVPRNASQTGNHSPLVSGRQTFQAIWLNAGDLVSNIAFTTWTTAAGTPTNQWFSLYSLALAKLGVTVDDTTVAWAGFSRKTLAMSTPYLVTASGLYYVGIMVAAGTPPSLAGAASPGVQQTDPPILIGSDATNVGLTTPATAPATAATPTGGATIGGTLVVRIT